MNTQYKNYAKTQVEKALKIKYSVKPYINPFEKIKNVFSNTNKKDIEWYPFLGTTSKCDDLPIIDLLSFLKKEYPEHYFKCDNTSKFSSTFIGYRNLYVAERN